MVGNKNKFELLKKIKDIACLEAIVPKYLFLNIVYSFLNFNE